MVRVQIVNHDRRLLRLGPSERAVADRLATHLEQGVARIIPKKSYLTSRRYRRASSAASTDRRG
jgi:hypothetical protein